MCALKATVLSAVRAVELAVDDLKMAVQHVQRSAPTYVPGQEPSYSETSVDVSMVVVRFETEEVDNDRVMASDWKGLVFWRDGLPDFQTNDVIRCSTASDDFVAGDYRIVYDDKVMVGSKVALHQLHLRLL